MGNIKRFAAINTKVMALEGKLLEAEDYRKLLAKQDIQEVVEYLKEHSIYKDALTGIDIYDITVDELELIFKKHMVKQYEKLIHYFTGEYRKLFKALCMRYEAGDVKLYLRAIIREEDLSSIKNSIIYRGIYNTIDHEKIMKSRNLEDFVENLKGSVYYRLLKPYLNEEPDRRLFYMEMVLDGLYFKILAEQVEKLEPQDKRVLQELLGKNVDLLNLQWIYRGLKFYKVSPEELINYSLGGGYHLPFHKIKDLCYAKNEEDLMSKMIDSKYGFLFDNKATLEIFMERRMERYLYFLFLEYKRKEKMNIIESMVYIHLLEYEMRDIISIAEAIKYGFQPEETKKFLVRKL